MATVQALLISSGTTASAMRQEALVESAPEMLKQLPNLPPDTTVALPFSVPFIAEPPEPLLITVEPLTLSKDKCNIGVLSTGVWPWTLAHSDANNAPRTRRTGIGVFGFIMLLVFTIDLPKREALVPITALNNGFLITCRY